MSARASVQTVERLYAAFGRGDFSTLLNGFSAEVDWDVPGPASVPICGRRHGREQVAQFFRTLGDTLETQQFEPQKFIAQRDDVVVLGHERHRVKATGRTVEADWVQVFTIRNGVVVRYREYIDTEAWAAAFRAA